MPHFFGYPGEGDRLRQTMGASEEKVLSASKDAWDSIVSEVHTKKPELIILSAEAFFSCGTRSGFDTFISALLGLADHITVVAYLRDPASLYLSSRQQSAKNSARYNPPAAGWFRTALEPYLTHPDIELKVHKFDRKELIGEDIISDFSSRYMPSGVNDLLIRPAEDSNTSISAEAMALLELVRFQNMPLSSVGADHMKIKDFVKLVRRIDDALPGKTRMRFKSGCAAAIYDFRTDLEWVEQIFGIHFTRPNTDERTYIPNFDQFQDSRDFCEVDEQRYAILVHSVSTEIRRERSVAGYYGEFIRNIGRWRTRWDKQRRVKQKM